MKTFQEFLTESTRQYTVHVNDGSDYGTGPSKKEAKYIESGADKFGGIFDGLSDKGVYFVFNNEKAATDFVNYISKSASKNIYADITK
jgi:hypothetical protein